VRDIFLVVTTVEHMVDRSGARRRERDAQGPVHQRGQRRQARRREEHADNRGEHDQRHDLGLPIS
jgi:hypothetical protein